MLSAWGRLARGCPGTATRSLLPAYRRAAASSASGTYDVIVIGAGVIGSACALELRRKGFTTLNVDAGPSPGYGSTSSSSAIIRHYYSLQESCLLAWESYHCWRSWADHLEAPRNAELCHLREVGIAALDVPASEACTTYLARVQRAMSACGIPVQHWDTAELQRRMPYLSTKSFYPPRRIDDERFGTENGTCLAGALFCQQAGYVDDPQLAARNLAEAAMRSGAEFRWRAQVTKIVLDGTGSRVKGVVLKDGSRVEAPIIINVAGPYSAAVHRMAFEDARVTDDSLISSQPLKVEVAYVQEPPGACVDQTMPVIADLDAGIYMRPQQGGQMLIGSIEPECDELHFLPSPDDLSEALTEEWTHLVYRAGLRLPTLQVPNTARGLTALYDTTPDWVPLYDRGSLGGFYSMRGTSGNQFKNAPVAGRICAHLVENCENGHDHDAAPLALPLYHTGESLNLGVFSRLRGQASTTGTVMG